MKYRAGYETSIEIKVVLLWATLQTIVIKSSTFGDFNI